MNLARFTVGRPIATTMITMMVVLIGTVSLFRLPIDLLPEVSSPTLSVVTEYANASPEEMEELITRPVERAVAAVPGVESLTSISAEGQSNVRVTFAWGTDLDVASNDIRDRLDRIINNLPEDAERPQLRKFDIAAFPILILGVSSEMDPLELRLLVDEQIQYRLERLSGVASVDVFGGLQREVQINLDVNRIKALGLPLNQITQALRDANVIVPAGEIESGLFEISLRTPGEFASLEELGQTIVDTRGGAPIRLNQIAEIRDTHQKISRIIRIDGKPGIRLGVRKQSGTNTVDVAKRVLAEVDKLNADMPQLRITPVIDTSTYIQQSLTNVSRTVIMGGILAILVLLFFLRNVRSTLIIATAIPVSIVATFAMMYFGGFTMNLMTLGGLAMGVGMMLDNSIVVLENIFRHHEQGKPRKIAAFDGASEVTAPVIASTLTTLVIFLPLTLVRGVAGELFGQLAYVIVFSLACSLVVSLTIVPMLCGLLLRSTHEMEETRASILTLLVGVSGRALDVLDTMYSHILRATMGFRLVTLLVVLAAGVATLALIPGIGTEFMPATDEGEVRVNVEMEVGTRLDIVDQQMRKIESIIEPNVPEMRSWAVNIGASGFRPGAAATGEIRISLVPLAERNRRSEEIASDLRKKLVGIPGVTIRTRAAQGMFLLNRLIGGDENIQIEVRGYDLQVLDALAGQVRAIVEDTPGITDVRVSREAGAPQLLIRIERDRAADLGLSVLQIAKTLETAVGGTRAGDYRDAGLEYPIVVRLDKAEQLRPDDILDLQIVNSRGESVVLRNVVHMTEKLGPIQIERSNQQRIATVSANTVGRDPGSVIADIRQQLREMPIPQHYEVVFGGDYEQQQEAFRELVISLVLSLIMVYMVLACLYESLRDPMVVMFSVPLATIGVILILHLTGTTFNIQSFIGCIMLGGIVVNNAILLVDQAGLLRTSEGMTPVQAVIEAGRRRLRPILMTTLTTILGLLPLALGIGEGAEAQAPMARAVIGGLATSSLITLVVVPIVYSLFHYQRAARTAQ